MTVFRVMALGLALGLVAACDEPPKDPAPVPTAPRTEVATAEPAKPAEAPEPAPAPLRTTPPDNPPPPASRAAPPDKAPPGAGIRPGAVESATKAPPRREPLPPVKLDLRLPDELVRSLEPGEPLERLPEQPLLPPLFVEKPAEPGPYQLNGRLITNERVDDYWESVEGAELQIEFRN